MSKITRIRNSYVEVFKKFAQNTRQHCYTKLGKKPKIAIFRCLKNRVRIELSCSERTERSLKIVCERVR